MPFMKTNQPTTIYLKNEAASESLAQKLAPFLKHPPYSGGHIYLRGDLGAGKTTFARAILRTLGVRGRIKSPSYALAENYVISDQNKQNAYHLDFYRFNDPREWLDAGFRELFTEKNAIIMVEWPEKAQNLLPKPDLEIQLMYQEPGRMISLLAHSEKGIQWLQKLKQ